ncbi:MAG TPA: hypothetical protein VNI79_04615 [Sphingomicrobium sp.]|nr:hypothetical protein [Sphingomicrobium sp.]
MRRSIFPGELPEHVLFSDTTPAPGARLVDPDEDDAGIDFTPVPRIRKRRNGWTDVRQREFIVALARCGSVSAAARHVGSTTRSAYRLLDAPGADSFAAAWDRAISEGYARVRDAALARSLHGAFVPVYRRGKLARVEHRHNDKLAIALLSSRDQNIDEYRRSAVMRRAHKADLAALDEARAQRIRSISDAEAYYRSEVDQLVEKIHLGPEPRIRSL